MDQKIRISCLCCEGIVEVDKSWAETNGKVFCNSCCKSFDVEIQEEDNSTEDYDWPF